MPWTGKEFASKHNHSLKGAKATKAAAQATAMVKRGVPEGEAIATANKSAEGHMARRRAQGLKHHEIAKEFETSRQTIGRKLKKRETDEPMRQGYNKMGSAM